MKAGNVLIGLIFLYLLSVQPTLAQYQTLDWVKLIAGANNHDDPVLTTDVAGNVYTSHFFYDTLPVLSIQKIDNAGNLIWAKEIFGYEYFMIDPRSITVDSFGNVLTTGWFHGTAGFDPGNDVFDLTAIGSRDAFILKLDASGNVLWAKQIGNNYTMGKSIATDAMGNVYSTGLFIGTIDFDPGPETAILTSQISGNSFIQKLDSDGNFLWVKQIKADPIESIAGIAVDVDGNIYGTSTFSGTVDFDPGEDTFFLTATSVNIVVLKLDTDGNFLWVTQMGGDFHDYPASIALDMVGNSYSAGMMATGPGGSNDIAVRKLDPNGNILWEKQMGGSEQDFVESLTVDAAGNSYTTGRFTDIADFDPGIWSVNLTSEGGTDIFIQSLDTDGNFRWVKQMGGYGYDLGTSIAVDGFGNIYSTGLFEETVDFDPGPDSTFFTAGVTNDIYLQKLSPCYATGLEPNLSELPALTHQCSIGLPSAPTADNGCEINFTGTTTTNFPIIDQSITEIVWTFDDGNGNVASQTQPIIWIPINVATTLTDVTITANNAGAQYQWLDCDNNYAPLAGENEQSFTASANGNYAVEIIESGCVDTSACVSIFTVAINEISNSLKVAVYPNPSTDIFTIAFDKVVDKAALTITDLQGRLIVKRPIQNMAQTDIELNQSPGFYILTIKSRDGQATLQLIKQ